MQLSLALIALLVSPAVGSMDHAADIPVLGTAGAEMVAAEADAPPKKPKPRPKPQPSPKPVPDPCPTCGMG